jgi:hypothetical protein
MPLRVTQNSPLRTILSVEWNYSREILYALLDMEPTEDYLKKISKDYFQKAEIIHFRQQRNSPHKTDRVRALQATMLFDRQGGGHAAVEETEVNY